LRNREAAKRTRDMFISISVLRAYWYSGVPSSSTASWSKNSLDSSRASLGATFDGSVISGISVERPAVVRTVVCMVFPPGVRPANGTRRPEPSVYPRFGGACLPVSLRCGSSRNGRGNTVGRRSGRARLPEAPGRPQQEYEKGDEQPEQGERLPCRAAALEQRQQQTEGPGGHAARVQSPELPQLTRRLHSPPAECVR